MRMPSLPAKKQVSGTPLCRIVNCDISSGKSLLRSVAPQYQPRLPISSLDQTGAIRSLEIMPPHTYGEPTIAMAADSTADPSGVADDQAAKSSTDCLSTYPSALPPGIPTRTNCPPSSDNRSTISPLDQLGNTVSCHKRISPYTDGARRGHDHTA